jgi:hypothetical protein
MRFLALVIVLLAALSLPGVRAARAEADLVPPAAKLFSWKSAPLAPARPSSCSASGAAASPAGEARRLEAFAQLAELMQAAPADADVVPLNGRGFAYPVAHDPFAELQRIQLEAQRLRAQRAAGGS